ncbi:MAG: hypothetical protein ACOYOS_04645 [Syntrophales bacterium]
MLFTILVVAIMLGLVMPLFWIFGTVGTVAYVGLKGMGAARKEQTFDMSPQLGFTMADGGEPVDEKVSMTETPQDSSEHTQKPVRNKMFWWGGY